MTIQTFYFDTGVTPESGAPLYGIQIWRGGTKQIPFTCDDVPDGARFMFACNKTDMLESKLENVIIRKILNGNEPGGLLSDYAYFKILKSNEKDL